MCRRTCMTVISSVKFNAFVFFLSPSGIGAFSTTLSAILSHPVQFQVLARSVTSLVLSGDIRDFACGSQGGGGDNVRFVVVVSLGDAREEVGERKEEGGTERDSREGREILWNLMSPRMNPVMLE